jgi:Rrf2 family protein
MFDFEESGIFSRLFVLSASRREAVRVTRSEEYGLRLILRIADHGEQLTTRELATLESLPEPTVGKVIARLRDAGLVEAIRGRRGGFRLARPADGMSLAEVIAAFDAAPYGRDFCSRMSPGSNRCTHSSGCGLRPVWRGLTAVISDFLAGITVADIIAGRRAGRVELPLHCA